MLVEMPALACSSRVSPPGVDRPDAGERGVEMCDQRFGAGLEHLPLRLHPVQRLGDVRGEGRDAEQVGGRADLGRRSRGHAGAVLRNPVQ